MKQRIKFLMAMGVLLLIAVTPTYHLLKAQDQGVESPWMRLPEKARTQALEKMVEFFPEVPISDRPFRSPLTDYLISPVALHKYWLRNPDAAPPQARAWLRSALKWRERLLQGGIPTPGRFLPSLEEQEAFFSPFGIVFSTNRFNQDSISFPQNEPSVAVCPNALGNPQFVLGATNDYRGIFDAEVDFTGWHYSNDGGFSLLKEGPGPVPGFSQMLPGVIVSGNYIPSGGDPVVASLATPTGCNFYVASLNFDFVPASNTFFTGIGVTSTDVATLNGACTGDACWPSAGRTPVVFYTDPPADLNLQCPPGGTVDLDFVDKEWMAVGPDGAGGNALWVVYTHFRDRFADNNGITGCDVFVDEFTDIEAVKCTLNASGQITGCSSPTVLDSIGFFATFSFLQFGYISVAPNGKVYATWAKFEFLAPDAQQLNTNCATGNPVGFPCNTVEIRMSVFNPASGTWSAPTPVTRETKPIRFSLHGLRDTNFRIATHPKSAVRKGPLGNRLWVVWDHCQVPPGLDDFGHCPNAGIRAAYTDNDGASWTFVDVAQGPGHQFFPTPPAHDPVTGQMVIGYYSTLNSPPLISSRYDDRYDVYVAFAPGGAAFSGTFSKQRLTSAPTDHIGPWSGIFFHGHFIGDYFQIAVLNGKAYAHYTAEYTRVPPFGAFDQFFFGAPLDRPMADQDNYLAKFTVP